MLPNIIMSIISVLAAFLQLQFQSHIDTRSSRIISVSLVALLAYVLVEYNLLVNRNNNTAVIRFLRENRLCFGALPCTLLLHILSPSIGWATTVVWICYVVKKGYDEMVYHNVSIADIPRLVRDAFFKLFDKFNHAIFGGSPEDESPV
ncbi:hypothetical protein TIFTF001_028965 [Ficus carica]|uniref:Uncharacterized protein n=1 Tax=Ficus carica TaxID=3494 RepID=A0AA88DQQ3_FICCA|nr:hypothetical protein TIFTF001_028965 [Ficus carica]